MLPAQGVWRRQLGGKDEGTDEAQSYGWSVESEGPRTHVLKRPGFKTKKEAGVCLTGK